MRTKATTPDLSTTSKQRSHRTEHSSLLSLSGGQNLTDNRTLAQKLCVFTQLSEAIARSRRQELRHSKRFERKLVIFVKLPLMTSCGWSFLVLLLLSSQAQAETDEKEAKADAGSESGWHVGGEMNAFYTDDVPLFSASQRL